MITVTGVTVIGVGVAFVLGRVARELFAGVTVSGPLGVGAGVALISVAALTVGGVAVGGGTGVALYSVAGVSVIGVGVGVGVGEGAGTANAALELATMAVSGGIVAAVSGGLPAKMAVTPAMSVRVVIRMGCSFWGRSLGLWARGLRARRKST